MGSHWARQQVRNNELEGSVAKTILWIKANKRISGIIAGSVLVACLIGWTAYHNFKVHQNKAWEKLGLAEGLYAAGHKNKAFSEIKSLESQYLNTPAAGYGLLFAGDVSYSTHDYTTAESYYQQLEATNSQALTPFALNDLALTYEAAKLCDKAEIEAQKFLNLYPDHFLAPQVHSVLARCYEAQGKMEDAKVAYQKIALEYPNTYFAAWAQDKISPKGGKSNSKKTAGTAVKARFQSPQKHQKRPRKT